MNHRTQAKAVRTAGLYDVSRISLVSRVDYIANACRGKRVVDLGCVSQGGGFAATQSPDWLHGQILAVGQKVVGLDADADGISLLRKQGYNCIEGDAESLDSINFIEPLGGTVDLIVAGELMEHLSNPGRFLDSCRRVLQTQGSQESQLIISVPSPYWYRQMLAVMSGKEYSSSDHNCWYSPTTLTTLLMKHDFQVKRIVGYSYGSSNRVRDFRHKIIAALAIPMVRVLLHLAKAEDDVELGNGRERNAPSLLWAEGLICVPSVSSEVA
jgi:2-polyprenyl-3-methyl-5-hydroxy-6-metoxy-1,4-benzoquinol methylase